MKYVKIYDSKGLCTGVADIDQNYDKAGYVKLFDSNMHIIGFIDVDNIPESGADMPFVQVFDKNMQPCGVVTADNIRHSDGYLITLRKDPSTTGSVTGGGRFIAGTSVTVVATPDTESEYPEFDGWYEGETKVSENASYTFTVSGTRTLVAKFKEATPPSETLFYKQLEGASTPNIVNTEGLAIYNSQGMGFNYNNGVITLGSVGLAPIPKKQYDFTFDTSAKTQEISIDGVTYTFIKSGGSNYTISPSINELQS